jgi:precorrin-4/cobalt-precorrin-4 C11-methyltransferase
MPANESVARYAAVGGTLAVFLSAARPEELRAELLGIGSHYTPTTAAVIAARVTWPDERIVRTTVGDLATDLLALGARATVLVLVGDALAPSAPAARSHVYAPDYEHSYRSRAADD